MKKTIFYVALVNMIALILCGCGDSPDVAALKTAVKNYKSQPNEDVTGNPHYNFSSFSGTLYKTKVKIALAEVTRYTNERVVNLLPPDAFDSNRSDYRPVHNMHMISVLPVGTHLRMERLILDNGMASLLWITASIEGETNIQKIIYVDPGLLIKNRFVRGGSMSNTNWGVNPEMLEAVNRAASGSVEK